MWANLLNILSRSGVGSCLSPRDMRDEANNSVMSLLFLSGDWWEESGGQGPGPGRGMQTGSRARLLFWNQPKLPMLWGQAGRARPRPQYVWKGCPCPSPISMLLVPRFCTHSLVSRSQSTSPWQLHDVDSYFHLFICSIREIPPSDVNGVPYVKHVQSVGPRSKAREQRAGSTDSMPTCVVVWKRPPGIKFMFLILVWWSGWEPSKPQLEAPSSDHLMNSVNVFWVHAMWLVGWGVGGVMGDRTSLAFVMMGACSLVCCTFNK